MLFTLGIIGCAVVVCTLVRTLISQFIISCLTGGKVFILGDGDFPGDGIVVCTIIGDVQSAIAIYEGQVAIAVEAAGMSCTQRD